MIKVGLVGIGFMGKMHFGIHKESGKSKVVAICGDGGFMMNSQELETAVRLDLDLTVIVLRDNSYGMIKWKQAGGGFVDYGLDFGNPDFVKYAESFGAKGYRVTAADELQPLLERAIADNTVVIIDCPVDYSQNMKLTERLGKLVCPI